MILEEELLRFCPFGVIKYQIALLKQYQRTPGYDVLLESELSILRYSDKWVSTDDIGNSCIYGNLFHFKCVHNRCCQYSVRCIPIHIKI